jgi:hypothetical protein
MRGTACAIAFVLSSGYLFARNRENALLNMLAGILALLSGIYAVIETIGILRGIGGVRS